MDLSRRDFGKWMGALGIGAVSSSAFDRLLPSSVEAGTIITPSLLNISASREIEGFYSREDSDQQLKKWKDESKWEIEIETKTQQMVYQVDSISWIEDHDSSINEPQVKIYKDVLDLTIPVEEQGKRMLNYIYQNYTYRVIAKNPKLITHKGST